MKRSPRLKQKDRHTAAVERADRRFDARKAPWRMPEWMKQYKPLISNTGGNPIEELMNDDGTNSNVFNNAPRALICVAVKCQVGLLEALHKKEVI